MLGLGWGDYKEVKILRHLGSSPLHRRVSKRIIHFCTKETPAWLWLRCEQVWVVIVCTVTSEQKGNLKMIDSGDLGGKILCWFHCLPTVLGNSIAEVVSDFNSWIFFFLPYFFQMIATDKLGWCHRHVVPRYSFFLRWVHLIIAWIIEKLQYFKQVVTSEMQLFFPGRH